MTGCRNGLLKIRDLKPATAMSFVITCGLWPSMPLRTLKVSQIVGVKALLVHAISEEARRFYRHFGFQESPIDPMTLMLSVKMIRHHYGE